MNKKWTILFSIIGIVILAFAVFYVYSTFSPLKSNGVPSPTSELIGNGTGNKVQMSLFYGQGCPHCAAEEAYFNSIKDKYNLDIKLYEIYFNKDNSQFAIKLATAYGQEIQGVPTLFVNGKIIAGFSPEIQNKIENEILNCSANQCANPENVILPKSNDTKQKLTIPAVMVAAIVDAINPCAFAVLILLLTTVLASGTRRKALYAGLSFASAIFISYMLMGLGIYTAIKFGGISRIFYMFVSILALIVGLFHIKDYFWHGKFFLMEVPLTWRPKMKMLIRNVVSVPGAFLVGLFVSLFLLPCTSGPYIVILGLLAQVATHNYAILMLLLYNFTFILPMIAITLLVAFEFTTAEQAEEWRQNKLRLLHLIAGILMIGMGIFMLALVILGYL